MKRNFFVSEITLAAALIALLTFLWIPFARNEAMSMRTLAMTNGGLVLVFVAFAGLVWKERARDERESLHRMLSNRAAYLAGTGFLLLAVIIRSFEHALDPWLVIALSVMIAAKIAGSIYSRIKY